MLLGAIELTTSVSVRLSAASKCGSTVTVNVGCVVPAMFTFDTPGSCSTAGTIELFATAPKSACEYLSESSANVTMTGSLGLATRKVGGEIDAGNCRCAD